MVKVDPSVRIKNKSTYIYVPLFSLVKRTWDGEEVEEIFYFIIWYDGEKDSQRTMLSLAVLLRFLFFACTCSCISKIYWTWLYYTYNKMDRMCNIFFHFTDSDVHSFYSKETLHRHLGKKKFCKAAVASGFLAAWLIPSLALTHSEQGKKRNRLCHHAVR